MIDLEVITLFLPAFAAGILVLSTHFLLGRQVLKRGIVFMDLAIAQIAALGAIVAYQMSAASGGHQHYDHLVVDNSSFVAVFLLIAYSNMMSVIMPLVFSLVAAGIIALLSRFMEKELEAVIGCIYVLAASAITLLLANDPNGAEYILKTLGGNILWLTWGDLFWPSLLSVLFLLIVALVPRSLSGFLFYPLFAAMITVSVQLVGIYLVFSMLIMPAVAVSGLTSKKALLLGYLMGSGSVFAGLILSNSFDWPGGAAVVLVLGLTGCLIRIGRSLFNNLPSTQTAEKAV